MSDRIENVVIVGSGPAGYTAALYTARANLEPVVIEGFMWGGLLQQTTDVENFPGFPDGIMGPDLMTNMRAQAARFGAKMVTDLATEIVMTDEPGGLHEVHVGDTVYKTRAVILAMGAEHKKLGIPGEDELGGRGVSYCATCDAAFFREQPTLIVGGGDSAMEEAIFLAKFSSKVVVVHRRDEFRASKIMVDRAQDTPNLEFMTPYVVDEFLPGENGALDVARLKHSETGETHDLTIKGAFIAIGHEPQSQLVSDHLATDHEGYVIVDAQAPPESAAGRTLDVVRRIEDHFGAEPAVAARTTLLGYGFSGQGQNAAIAFVTLKDWAERGPGNGAEAVSARANAVLGGLPDAIAMALSPPAIEALGNSSGFAFRLQDRAQQGQAALAAARDQLLKAAQQSPILQGVYVEGLPTAPQIELTLDRQKANALGVTFADINDALSTSLGSAYVNDFPNQARMQRVIVQAEAGRRMRAEDLLDLNVRNAKGQMVPLQSFARIAWTMGPSQIVGFNGYPSIKISGSAAPGYASGDAMAEMERLAAQLPPGFDFAWTGQSLQEKLSGSQATYLLALALVCVFLCLAALYESWAIPLAVLLVVPTGVVGAIFAMLVRDMPNDVYFKVGLITVIGLTAKNAILIIEVAKDLVARGRPVQAAALEACELRFRPIIMTSFAFILGVVPLAVANGASMNSQRAIGTGVLGGMVTATVLAVFATPLFYVLIARAMGARTAPSPADGGARAGAPGTPETSR